jgi:peptide deformylase
MVRKILKHPDALLHTVSHDMDIRSKDLKQIIRDMLDTLRHNKGVGLAAPQIGELRRVIVWDTHYGTRNLINPVIVSCSMDMTTTNEQCLSVPGIIKSKQRPWRIMLKGFEFDFYDERVFAIYSMPLSGLEATIVQHEIDHLDGRTIAC